MLKNRDRRTSTTTQSLPMLPKDLKIIVDFLDQDEDIHITRKLCFKAFASTVFCLWTRYTSSSLPQTACPLRLTLVSRNEELINMQFRDVKPCQYNEDGEWYAKFTLLYRKTNKDPDKGKHQLSAYCSTYSFLSFPYTASYSTNLHDPI